MSQNDFKECPKCHILYNFAEYYIFYNEKYYTFEICVLCRNLILKEEWKQKSIDNAEHNLKQSIIAKISSTLKIVGFPYNGDIFNYLPYTPKDLKNHIENQFEPWMAWWNRGKYIVNHWKDNDPSTWKWQIDHIIPVSTFNYFSIGEDDFRKCWALDNLRPLSAKQNVIDGVRRVRHAK
jgi:hypothetical protein